MLARGGFDPTSTSPQHPRRRTAAGPTRATLPPKHSAQGDGGTVLRFSGATAGSPTPPLPHPGTPPDSAVRISSAGPVRHAAARRQPHHTPPPPPRTPPDSAARGTVRHTAARRYRPQHGDTAANPTTPPSIPQPGGTAASTTGAPEHPQHGNHRGQPDGTPEHPPTRQPPPPTQRAPRNIPNTAHGDRTNPGPAAVRPLDFQFSPSATPAQTGPPQRFRVLKHPNRRSARQ